MAFGASRLMTGPQVPPKATPPLFRSPSSKSSPVRGSRNDQILNLKRVIGTTATSNNGFDCLEKGSVFAFIAGSGAVLATLGSDQAVSQRFFRARPSAAPFNSTSSIYDSPTPIGPVQSARSRTAASLRDGGFGSMSFGSPMNDYIDSPGTRTATRTKASTCISLSPDGRLLAIGETGHKPRVLIFSTAKDAPTDIPLTSLSEHTFGVRCLAFSPDSQYLASLGDMNDGFLYIWNVNQRTGSATLHASNKCTSNIRQIAWMGNNLITVGTRHVKVWRIEENAPSGRNSPTKRMSDMSFALTSPTAKVLVGRNCLLGSLLDKTFTTVAATSTGKAIVCSDQGEICLLDDTSNPPQFVKIAHAGFGISSMAVHCQKFAVIAGFQGQLRLFDLDQIVDADDCMRLSEVTLLDQGSRLSQINVIALFGDRLITIDGQRSLQIFDPTLDVEESVMYSLTHRFPAHGGAVLGIHAFPASGGDDASFLTWSAEGMVLFWTANGVCKGDLIVPVEQIPQGGEEYVNELKVVRAFRNGELLASGDKFGVFRVIRISDGKTIFDTKAHTSDITDLTFCENGDNVLIASSGRDRTVQLFQWHSCVCEHLQTLEEHTGAVTGLVFSREGDRLISCSSDRSIMIMEAVFREKKSNSVAGFLSSRPLTLKASPVSMDLVGNDTLLVSTIDRNILSYDLNTGNLNSSFKASDQDGGDAVVINSVVHVSLSKRSKLIAGVSGTDKSIRIYDETGRLLEREYGHTEGMTGVAVVSTADTESHKSLVTVATDGTVFVWDPSYGQDQLSDLLSSMDISGDSLRASQAFASRPPLRKVLSSSELTRLHGLREDVHEQPEKQTTPAPERPTLKKRSSRLSMLQTPKLEPTVGVSNRRASTAQGEIATTERSRRGVPSSRPSSPSSPRQYAQTMRATSKPPQAPPPLQAGTRARRKSAGAGGGGGEFGNSLAASNDAVCRTLHGFRKKLASSSDMLPLEGVRELERELSLTAKALAQKSKRSETAVARLLDQYSERLVELLDGRIERSVQRQIQFRAADRDAVVVEVSPPLLEKEEARLAEA